MSDNTLPTSEQVEKARRMNWPFRGWNRPMGQLMDEGIVTYQDLGFAVDRAHDAHLRKAARILLLHRLAQSPEEAQSTNAPLNVIVSRNRTFAERRQAYLFILLGFIMGVTLSLTTLALIFSISPGDSATSDENVQLAMTTETIIVIVIILGAIAALFAGFFWLLDWAMKRIEKQIRLYYKGQKAEDEVLNVLYYVLDSRWWVFRNVTLPGRRTGDIDFVLVGPAGMWAFEVKAYDGVFRTWGDQWERQMGAKWVKALTNPTQQAKRNAATLSGLLKASEMTQWVEPIVIWANPESTVRIEHPSAAVWQVHELVHELKRLQDGNQRLGQQQIEQIVETLKGLYREPFSERTSPSS